MSMLSIDRMRHAAKSKPCRIVVTCAENYEALSALQLALQEGYLTAGILVGIKDKIAAIAPQVGIDVTQFEIHECADPVAAADLSVRLLVEGKADYPLKGQIDTRILLKAILNKQYGLVPPDGLLSHVAWFEVPEYSKPFIITDAAINIAPNVSQKAQIIKNAIAVCRKLGVARPKVALVCAVEKVNSKIASTVEAQQLVQLAQQGEFGDAIVEGPYDMYIAMSKTAAATKGSQGQIQGDADILVFPELNAANAIYKALQLFNRQTEAAGIISGARFPIMLPSRSDSTSTKLNGLVMAAYLR